MKCTNCGLNVPFTGTVCPYCKANKSGRKSGEVTRIIFGYAGLVFGGLIGWGANNEVPGAFIGSFVGMLIGICVGTAVSVALQSGNADTAPPAPPSVSAPDRIAAPQVLGHALPQNAQPPSPEYEAALIASGEFRRCPQCAEVIRRAAKVCRFCGHDLPKGTTPNKEKGTGL